MLPTVEELCTKNVITVSINDTLQHAIELMAKANVRTVLVIDKKPLEFYLLTVNDTINYKIYNIALDTKLSELTLKIVKKIDAKINILEVIDTKYELHEYMVVMKKEQLLGIISQTDIINNIDPHILMQKQTIGNIILQYTTITIYEDVSTINAIKMMQSKHIDALIVLNQQQKPIGIFTTKNFLQSVSTQKNLKLPIKNFMTSPIDTVPSDITIAQAIEFIQTKHYKRIVVANKNDIIVGLITQTELLRMLNNKWIEMIKKRGTELSNINKILIEKTTSLEEKASKDFLTKLYNRRKFDTLINHEIKQIQRYDDRFLSLIIIDIDDFKSINDTYGHDIGDKILQDMALILKTSIRDSDIACRWGGEEFAVSLTHTSIDEALLVAQKIRVSVEKNYFSNDIKLTISLGVSQLYSQDSYPNLFKRADEALYKAKNSGKNKVVISNI